MKDTTQASDVFKDTERSCETSSENSLPQRALKQRTQKELELLMFKHSVLVQRKGKRSRAAT